MHNKQQIKIQRKTGNTDYLHKAKDLVFADISSRPEWHEEVCRGKMFGVLLVATGESTPPSCARLLHDVDGVKVLFAYSGQILGRSDWDGYVPAIFDYLQDDGYFKRHEAQITDLNQKVYEAEHSAAITEARCTLAYVKAQSDAEVEAYRTYIKEHKATRTVAEAQYQNAELRRLKHNAATAVSEAQTVVDGLEKNVAHMKADRRKRSDALQRWLFTQHRLTLPTGETRPLLEVFTDYVRQTGSRQTLPPSGTGECCAPRLLNYANAHHLTPLALAEVWYGASPKGEVRHHGQFYEPCQAKCVPILGALKGTLADSRKTLDLQTLPLLYEDPYFLAVSKPAGLLSVPGRSGQPNAEDILRSMRPDCPFLKMTHRLDMDTSGVLLAAKDPDAHTAMQALFAKHEAVRKEYVAIVGDKYATDIPKTGKAPMRFSSTEQSEGKGILSMPLASDYLNRPRQRVDYEQGKAAVTHYEFTEAPIPSHIQSEGVTLHALRLMPLTGRTHQLRIHCAHPDGLDMPILGDPLYGNVPASRMYLHANVLEFIHPFTKQKVTITSPEWS